MDPGKAEVGMETVLHSHEDTGKKASGEKKKGREKGKVERSTSYFISSYNLCCK